MQKTILMRTLITSLFFLTISCYSFAQDKLEIQLQKGIEAFEKEKYAKAERIFDKLLEEESSYAAVYVWKGKCLVQFEEYQEAYEAFQTAINLDPSHAPYWLAMGNFKYHLGITSIRKPESCGDCGKFLIPDNSEMLKATDYYKAALKDFEKAIQLDARHGESYYQMAMTYDALNQKEKACEMTKKAVELKHPIAKSLSKKICP